MQKLDLITNSIFILKSDLHHKKDSKRLKTLFDGDSRIIDWNVDFSDVDKVIRIEACNIHLDEIIQLLNKAGISCEELAD